MKKYITLCISFFAVFLLSGCTPQTQLPENPKEINPIYTPTKYTGMLKQGSDIDREFCSEGYYLVTEDNTYLLRNNVEHFEMYSDPSNLNQEVTLALEIPNEDIMYCAALLCECEQWATVVTGVN